MRTVVDLLLALPTAPPIQEKLSVAVPEHFADRARAAAAVGHAEEANRFAKLSATLKDLLIETPATEPHGPGTEPNARTSAATSGDPAGRERPPADARQAGSSPGTSHSNEGVGDEPERRTAGANPEQPTGSIAAAGHGASTIAKLIDKLDSRITDDPSSPSQNEGVSEIVADLFTRLPTASPSESKLLVGLPPHLAERARQAEAAGYPEAANRFSVVSEMTGDLLSTLNDAVAPQSSQKQPPPDVPSAGERVNDAAFATAAPPALESNARPPQTEPPLNAPPGQQSDINRPIAKLYRQITEEASRLAQNEAIARTRNDILAWLRSAPTSDSQQMQASRFSDRVDGAKINGQDDATNRFGPVGDLLRDLGDKATNTDDGTSGVPPLGPHSSAKPTMTANKYAALGSIAADIGASGRSNRETGAYATSSVEAISIPADHRPAPQKRAAVKVPGVAVPRATKTTSTAGADDEQCRAISRKFAIGEEPTDAERDYLRHGCRQHG